MVAEDAGKIVGIVLGRFDGRRGWINHLAVDPGYRTRGLGRDLVKRVERRLVRKGCAKVNLHVEPENHGVSAFYVHIGYRPRDLLFMEKWFPESLPFRQDLEEAAGAVKNRGRVA